MPTVIFEDKCFSKDSFSKMNNLQMNEINFLCYVTNVCVLYILVQ